ncbi:MAG: gamma carbonic anhydrase family protein [bacterium]
MIHIFRNAKPRIHPSVFIAEGAQIIGKVSIGENSSVWFNTVIRGDIQQISIGKGSNIQDNSVLHVGEHVPCIVGNNVTVGHSVNLHGCRVEDNALVGIGAVVLTGAVIGKGAVVAAGSVVPEGMHVPAGRLVMGIPAKIKKIKNQKAKPIKTWSEEYIKLRAQYLHP